MKRSLVWRIVIAAGPSCTLNNWGKLNELGLLRLLQILKSLSRTRSRGVISPQFERQTAGWDYLAQILRADAIFLVFIKSLHQDGRFIINDGLSESKIPLVVLLPGLCVNMHEQLDAIHINIDKLGTGANNILSASLPADMARNNCCLGSAFLREVLVKEGTVKTVQAATAKQPVNEEKEMLCDVHHSFLGYAIRGRSTCTCQRTRMSICM
jgi:hypothetical protein